MYFYDSFRAELKGHKKALKVNSDNKQQLIQKLISSSFLKMIKLFTSKIEAISTVLIRSVALLL